MGIEPMTSFLPRMRSTPELRGQKTVRGFHPHGLNNMVGQAGLEPAKAYASGVTVRPLCHSGH